MGSIIQSKLQEPETENSKITQNTQDNQNNYNNISAIGTRFIEKQQKLQNQNKQESEIVIREAPNEQKSSKKLDLKQTPQIVIEEVTPLSSPSNKESSKIQSIHSSNLINQTNQIGQTSHVPSIDQQNNQHLSDQNLSNTIYNASEPSQSQIFGSRIEGYVPELKVQAGVFPAQNSKETMLTFLKENKKLFAVYEKYGPYKPPEDISFSGVFQQTKKDGNDYYEGFEALNLKNGYGKLLSDTEYYEGYFKNNEKYGWGRLININEEMKCGFWDNRGLQQQIKIINAENRYEGQGENSLPHGQGIWTCPNFIYQGQFYQGKKQGKGVIEIKGNDARYEGDFKDDKIHGQGQYWFKSGKKYTGTFEKGEMTGKGEMLWPDGKCYRGEFYKSNMHGQGIFKDFDGSEYEGQFQHNLKEGIGKFTYKGIELVGQWKNDQFIED